MATMAVDTNLGKAFEIDLNQSLNTETVDYDIQQIGMPSKPVSNNGFVRAGSITNLYKKSDATAGVVQSFTASTGDIVDIRASGTELYLNGAKAGNTTPYHVLGKSQINGVDSWVTTGNTQYFAVLEKTSPGSGLALKKYDYDGTLLSTVSTNVASQDGVAIGRQPNTTFENIAYCLVSSGGTTHGIRNITTGATVLNVTTTFNVDGIDNISFYVVGQYFAIVFGSMSDQVIGGEVVSCVYGKLDGTGITQTSGRYIAETWTSTKVTLTLTWNFNSGDTTGALYRTLEIASTGNTLTSVATGAGTLVNRVASHGMVMATNGAGVGSYIQKWYNTSAGVLTLNSSRNSNFSEFWNSPPETAGYAKLWTIGGKSSHISFNRTTSSSYTFGTLITEVGELDPYRMPQFGATSNFPIVYRNTQGAIVLLSIKSSTPSTMLFSEIIRGVIKVNTLTDFNVLEISTKTMHPGASPYNGTFIQTDVTGTGSELVALRYEGKYSNSVDVGGILTNVTAASLITGLKPLMSLAIDAYVMPVDIFVAGNYQNSKVSSSYSVTNAGIFRLDDNLVGTLYVENPNLPVPIGSTVVNDTAVSGQKTFFLNHNTLVYPIGNELAQAYTIFRLQGSTYGFDGSDIWLIPFNTGTVQTPVWIAPATGLTFLCESPQAAFFLAEYDNSVYGFDGGRMVQRVMNFNRKPAIQNAVYNVEESALHLVTASSYLIIRDGIVTEHARPFVSGTVNLYPSKNGVAREQSGAWSTLVLKSDTFAGETVETLTWQSGVVGPEDSQTAKFSQFVFRIYNPAGAASLSLTVNYKWITADETGTESKTVSLVAGDFDSNGYTTFRFCPVQDYALGASIGISCTSAVVLLSAVCYYTNGGPSLPTKVV
jgi:hypothetical protein